jgi:CHAT domain-containing protein/tetratricopeptide (TPR) repeat protein
MVSPWRRLLITCSRRTILFFCALVLVIAVGHFPQPVRANPLVQTGVEAYEQGNYSAAIAAWNSVLTTYSPPYSSTALAEQALVNENLARAHGQIGQSAIALDHWEAAATSYQASDNATQFGRMLTEQAQIYISLGQHQRALSLLCGAEPTFETADETANETAENTVSVLCQGGAYAVAQETQDAAGQAAALGSLAEAHRLRGKYDEAQYLLEAGRAIAKVHNLGQYEAPMLNSLGSIYARRAQIALRRAESAELVGISENVADLRRDASEYTAAALGYLSEAASAAAQHSDLAAELRVQISRLNIAQQIAVQPSVQQPEQGSSLTPIRQRLGQLIDELPSSRETAYAAIGLAQSYQSTHRDFSCGEAYQENPLQKSWLIEGQRLAKEIGDARAESFALGELGHLEECRNNLQEAADLSDQAQLAASDALESADSLYLWEWQRGRLYQRQGDSVRAQKAYKQAITTLETVRTDILTADKELQFDFRDTVEPIYRQYIELQLASVSAAPRQIRTLPTAQAQETLKSINALRLAELQNFFGNDCVLTPSTEAQTRLLEADPHTAVISSIVLSNKVVLIARFANGTSETLEIKEADSLKETANKFRRGLKRYRNSSYDQAPANALYQQLISPFETALADAQIETLVFVQDGFLRNIPMAALYDGEQYLIERYAVATTPALNLTATQALKKPVPRALAVGLSQETVTESGRNFLALDSVTAELASVSEQLPGSKILLDQEFTPEKLTAAWKETPYSILHLATHGQFSTIPEETFIITGSDSAGISEKLSFDELESLIRQSSSTSDTSENAELIDLITLTACETATGDDRATLGLAGVAIRSGARSAIASLWKLDDAAAATLVRRFYGNLQQNQISKAKALQSAQVAAIEDNITPNPGSWAPLILVGNWQ